MQTLEQARQDIERAEKEEIAEILIDNWLSEPSEDEYSLSDSLSISMLDMEQMHTLFEHNPNQWRETMIGRAVMWWEDKIEEYRVNHDYSADQAVLDKGGL